MNGAMVIATSSATRTHSIRSKSKEFAPTIEEGNVNMFQVGLSIKGGKGEVLVHGKPDIRKVSQTHDSYKTECSFFILRRVRRVRRVRRTILGSRNDHNILENGITAGRKRQEFVMG